MVVLGASLHSCGYRRTFRSCSPFVDRQIKSAMTSNVFYRQVKWMYILFFCLSPALSLRSGTGILAILVILAMWTEREREREKILVILPHREKKPWKQKQNELPIGNLMMMGSQAGEIDLTIKLVCFVQGFWRWNFTDENVMANTFDYSAIFFC